MIHFRNSKEKEQCILESPLEIPFSSSAPDKLPVKINCVGDL